MMLLFKNQKMVMMFQKMMMMMNRRQRRRPQTTSATSSSVVVSSVIGGTTAAFIAITATTSTLLLTSDDSTTTTTTTTTTISTKTETSTRTAYTIASSSSSSSLLSLPSVSSCSTAIIPSNNCYCSCEASSSSSATTSSSSSSSSSSTSSSSSSSKLVFLGTGSSTGCPKPICIMEDSPISKSSKCRVSRMAISDGGDPKHNKDYRNNPCLLIHHEGKNIIFDVGKTFREGAIRWMPTLNINTTGLDAVVLTHHHMDAAAGLDDLRGFQNIQRDDDDNWSRIPIQVYMSKFCHSQLVKQFPWLFPKPTTSNTIMKTEDGEEEQTSTPVIVKRDVASLDVTIFENYQSFEIYGIKITPLPVWHGDDLICHGFVIEVPKSNNNNNNNNDDNNYSSKSKVDDYTTIVYLSDMSRMIPKTLQYIQQQQKLSSPGGGGVDLFVCDSLLWHDNHPVHYSLDQAIELSQVIRPRLGTYTVGMNCDNYLPHDEMNLWLLRRQKRIIDDMKMKTNQSCDDSSSSSSDDDDDDDDNDDDNINLVQLAHDGLVIAL